MKKKLLSLVVAAAMVASTAMSLGAWAVGTDDVCASTRTDNNVVVYQDFESATASKNNSGEDADDVFVNGAATVSVAIGSGDYLDGSYAEFTVETTGGQNLRMQTSATALDGEGLYFEIASAPAFGLATNATITLFDSSSAQNQANTGVQVGTANVAAGAAGSYMTLVDEDTNTYAVMVPWSAFGIEDTADVTLTSGLSFRIWFGASAVSAGMVIAVDNVGFYGVESASTDLCAQIREDNSVVVYQDFEDATASKNNTGEDADDVFVNGAATVSVAIGTGSFLNGSYAEFTVETTGGQNLRMQTSATALDGEGLYFEIASNPAFGLATNATITLFDSTSAQNQANTGVQVGTANVAAGAAGSYMTLVDEDTNTYVVMVPWSAFGIEDTADVTLTNALSFRIWFGASAVSAGMVIGVDDVGFYGVEDSSTSSEESSSEEESSEVVSNVEDPCGDVRDASSVSVIQDFEAEDVTASTDSEGTDTVFNNGAATVTPSIGTGYLDGNAAQFTFTTAGAQNVRMQTTATALDGEGIYFEIASTSECAIWSNATMSLWDTSSAQGQLVDGVTQVGNTITAGSISSAYMTLTDEATNSYAVMIPWSAFGIEDISEITLENGLSIRLWFGATITAADLVVSFDNIGFYGVTEDEPVDELLLGDYNFSGTVTAYDALQVLKVSVDNPPQDTLTEDQFYVSDFDGSGTITAYDALLILRYAISNGETSEEDDTSSEDSSSEDTSSEESSEESSDEESDVTAVTASALAVVREENSVKAVQDFESYADLTDNSGNSLVAEDGTVTYFSGPTGTTMGLSDEGLYLDGTSVAYQIYTEAVKPNSFTFFRVVTSMTTDDITNSEGLYLEIQSNWALTGNTTVVLSATNDPTADASSYYKEFGSSVNLNAQTDGSYIYKTEVTEDGDETVYTYYVMIPWSAFDVGADDSDATIWTSDIDGWLASAENTYIAVRIGIGNGWQSEHEVGDYTAVDYIGVYGYTGE